MNRKKEAREEKKSAELYAPNGQNDNRKKMNKRLNKWHCVRKAYYLFETIKFAWQSTQ